jgi:uncharacterized protein
MSWSGCSPGLARSASVALSEVTGRMGRAFRAALITAIRIYQRTLSRVLPPSCRFHPSCSAYMIQAVERYGVLRGMAMGVWRICRCNPFSKGGYDPVPEREGPPIAEEAAVPSAPGMDELKS